MTLTERLRSGTGADRDEIVRIVAHELGWIYGFTGETEAALAIIGKIERAGYTIAAVLLLAAVFPDAWLPALVSL